LKELILSKLNGDELGKIVDEQMRLSQALGFAVGIHANRDEDLKNKESLIDES
jgi:hypothetical protein